MVHQWHRSVLSNLSEFWVKHDFSWTNKHCWTSSLALLSPAENISHHYNIQLQALSVYGPVMVNCVMLPTLTVSILPCSLYNKRQIKKRQNDSHSPHQKKKSLQFLFLWSCLIRLSDRKQHTPASLSFISFNDLNDDFKTRSVWHYPKAVKWCKKESTGSVFHYFITKQFSGQWG